MTRLLLILLLCMSASAQPPMPPAAPLVLGELASVTLAWDGVPDAGAYRVYAGTASGIYDATQTTFETNAVVAGLTPGTEYFFAVKTIGTNQLESDFSNEVAYTVPITPAPAPVSIGLRRVVVVDMVLSGSTDASGPWTQLASVPVVIQSDKPTGSFQVELNVRTVEGVDW